MLEIKNLQRRGSADKEILKGIDLARGRRARCTPSWGRTARARARSRGVLAGRPSYEVTGGAVTLRRPGPARDGPGGAGPRGRVPRVPVPGRDPRRQQRLLPEGGAQRGPQAPRRARARRDGVPGARQGEGEAARHGPGAAEPRRSTRASRAARRSATRSSRWPCSSRRSRSSTRPTRASTSTR